MVIVLSGAHCCREPRCVTKEVYMILVTGGAGFIGSNIVARLCDEGSEVIVCDWLGSDNIKWKNLQNHLIDRVVNPDSLGALLASDERIDAVVHMGAISATTAVDADDIVRKNFDASRQLWEYCAERDLPFVYASSAATYGDGSQGFSDDNSMEAMAKLQPLNLYGWSKKWFDMWVLNAVRRGRPTPRCWAGLKFFNVYGPNELHKQDMMSIVAKNYRSCMKGEPVKLFKSHHPDYGDGGQLRDFVYVDDCVDVVAWLLEQTELGGIFNVGSGAARSFRDLITAAYSAAGQQADIHYIDMPEHLRDKYQYFTQADLSGLRQAGYEGQTTPIEAGVAKYMHEYLMTDRPHR